MKLKVRQACMEPIFPHISQEVYEQRKEQVSMAGNMATGLLTTILHYRGLVWVLSSRAFHDVAQRPNTCSYFCGSDSLTYDNLTQGDFCFAIIVQTQTLVVFLQGWLKLCKYM